MKNVHCIFHLHQPSLPPPPPTPSNNRSLKVSYLFVEQLLCTSTASLVAMKNILGMLILILKDTVRVNVQEIGIE